jgi:hypothetical protein
MADVFIYLLQGFLIQWPLGGSKTPVEKYVELRVRVIYIDTYLIETVIF